MNDNRNYHYNLESRIHRDEYTLIAAWIEPKTRVIDLACGDGSLLHFLKKKKNLKHAYGIDISASGIASAKAKGIASKISRVDTLLPIKDKAFDYAICNVTLQMVMYPEILLREMSRISRYQIISFPNFAFVLNRFDLLFKGRMPRPMLFGYSWYSTGEIHQLSIKDFFNYCRATGFTIIKTHYLSPKRLFGIPNFFSNIFPNLFSLEGIFLLKSL